MVNSLSMEVLNATQQLHKASTGVCLIIAAPLQQRVQELPASQQLCDKVHLQRLPNQNTPCRQDALEGAGMRVAGMESCRAMFGFLHMLV